MIERKRFLVRTVTASDCLCELPTLQPYTPAALSLDVFIVAAGFEERVLEAPNRLRDDGIAVTGEILIGNYRTNLSDNQQRYEELAPTLASFGAAMSGFDADDPAEVVSVITDALQRQPSTELHVGFDVSGASSTLILAIMAALARFPQSIALTVFYTTAQTYDQPRSDGRETLVLDDQRETGISTEPLSAPFSGHHHDHLPVSVIALPSLYTDRLEACLAHLNVGPITGSADNLYWLLPATGADEHKWRQNHTRNAVRDLMLRLQGREDEGTESEVIRADDMETCDVLDYADTTRRLVDRIDELPGRNISIVHMGSKLQAIGVALAAAARSEVAVLTVRPASFNASKYSSGIGRTFVLHFPNLGTAVKAIANIGTLEISCP
ncbi:hypothetical protein [Xanthomonas bundabergensis]|uniref:hypothetical protein n=1 Tax=Xanthomonas bundabergensis TaxID=3160842 RepID=UPI003519C2BB